MRLSPKSLRSRVTETVDQAAAGSAQPAGQDPPAPGIREPTSARERGVMRRRIRRLRRVREALLMELGAVVFESERRGRPGESLARRKLDQLRVIENEVGALGVALGEGRPLVEVVNAGIAGACPTCGALYSLDAHFCANCGTGLALRGTGGSGAAAAGPPTPGTEASVPAGTGGPAGPTAPTTPAGGAPHYTAAQTTPVSARADSASASPGDGGSAAAAAPDHDPDGLGLTIHDGRRLSTDPNREDGPHPSGQPDGEPETAVRPPEEPAPTDPLARG